MKQFYVYELVIMPDGKVCYVGKGSGRRMYNHRKYAAQKPSSTQSYLYRKLSQLLVAGKNFEPIKVFETENETEALIEEKRRINHYGLENLFNCGLNHSGPVQDQITEARCEAMRKARLEHISRLQQEHGCKMLPEIAAKISKSNKGRIKSPEECAKLSSAKIGRPLSETHRAALKGIPKTYGSDWKPPTLGKKFTAATRKRMSLSHQKKKPTILFY